MDYGKWSLAKLQAELRLRGVRISGRKSALVERLQGLDAIQDARGSVQSNSVFASPASASLVSWPSATAYKSLITSVDKTIFPHFSEDDIEHYIMYR